MIMARESGEQTLKISDDSHSNSLSIEKRNSQGGSCSRLNAKAREFVPRAVSHNNLQYPVAHIPVYMSVPHVHVRSQNRGAFDQYDHEIAHQRDEHALIHSKDELSEEITHKIVNQVEYYFSDANLATTEHLMRFISKDPEGYVPISVVGSFKKIKGLVSNNKLLAAALRTSSKLVVSEDGKRVKRKHPFTEADVEEFQSRTIVAENLPDDHSYQNLMKYFSAVGSVKTIRTCQPQTANVATTPRTAKIDTLYSNKLHAFVEYETVELAERAVADLNDEQNWRNGLKVRLLIKRSTKPTSAHIRNMGHEPEINVEEKDESTTSDQLVERHHENHSQQLEILHDRTGDEVQNDKESGTKKGRGHGHGRGKGHRRNHPHPNNRGGHPVGTPPSNNFLQNDHNFSTKQPPPGPRMPDGTRGFTMGRGKPLATATI